MQPQQQYTDPDTNTNTDTWQPPTAPAPQGMYQPVATPAEQAQAILQQAPVAPTESPYTAQQAQVPTQPVTPAPPVLDTRAAEATIQPLTTEESDPTSQDQPSVDDGAVLHWQANEYVQQSKSAPWFVVMAVVVLALMAFAIFILRSVTFAILVPVMAVALVVYVRRPAAVYDYTLSRKGLHVNDRLYSFDMFKSFGIVSHDGHHAVALVPRKRFQLGQTVYFPEDIGEHVVDMFAARLPMKDVQPDVIDKLLAKLRL